MAFVANFSVTQNADCSKITITDTSNYGGSDPKGNFSARALDIQLADGTYLYQNLNFPIGGGNPDTKEITGLTKGYSMKITLKLTPVSANSPAVYTKDDYVALTCYLESGYYQRVAKMRANQKLYTNNDYVRKTSMLLVERDSAINAAAEMDISSAQGCLDRAQNIINDENTF